MEDTKTKVLNFLFLFLILFYIYPLKFLFNILETSLILQIRSAFGDKSSTLNSKIDEFNGAMLSEPQWFELFFFYLNALKSKSELELNALEIFETKTKLFRSGNDDCTCHLNIDAFFSSAENKGFAGSVYCLFGVIFLSILN